MVYVIVESTALFALDCLTHDKISHIYDIAQFAKLAAYYAAFEKFFGLFV
jgi:hypothetical protein